MDTLVETHLQNLTQSKEIIEAIAGLFLAACVLSIYPLFQMLDLLISRPSSDTIEMTALTASFFVFTGGLVLATTFEGGRLNDIIFENKHRYKGEELRNIGERIYGFYSPLLALLTLDENMTSQEKARKIAEIDCHKHLVEKNIRCKFEIYKAGHEKADMLKLVNGEIENLQNQYIRLTNELESE